MAAIDGGRLEEAEQRARDALDASRASGGDHDPSYPITARLLARVLRQRGRLGEGEMWLRVALKGLERLFGAAHADTAITRSDLAATLLRRGQYAEARRTAETALAAMEKARGIGDQDTRRVILVLARSLAACAAPEAAEAALERALAAAGPAGGERAAVLVELAEVALAAGRDTALGLATEAVEALGGEDAADASALGTLGSALLVHDRFEDAERVLRRAAELGERQRRAEDPSLCTTWNNLAVALAERGHYEEAGVFVDRALAREREIHGEGHPDHASVLCVRAQLDARLGREGAAALARSALATLERTLGREHWRTRRARADLDQVLAGQVIAAGDDEATVLAKCLNQARRALELRQPERALAKLAPLFETLPASGAEPIELAALPIQIVALAQLGRDEEALARLAGADAVAADHGGAGDRSAISSLREEVKGAQRAALQGRITEALEELDKGKAEGLTSLELLVERCLHADEPILAAGVLVHLGKLYYGAEIAPVGRQRFERALALVRQHGSAETVEQLEGLMARHDPSAS